MKFIADLESILPILVGAFIAAALGSLLLTPLVRRLAHRFDVVDLPDARRVNVQPIPRGGGLAVATAFLVVAITVLIVDRGAGILHVRSSLDQDELVALFVGGAVAVTIGALDDYFDLRARWQLAGQVVLAVLAVVLGIEIDFVNNPLTGGNVDFPTWFADVFTAFWIVGMMNSINWIDGLDGLSSGIGLIAAATLGLISLTTAAGPAGQPVVAVLCFVLAGSLLGFLRWNFHPASIFAGTSGVMFLGYTLALLSILGTAKVAVALLVLGVPIIDTFWIIVRRVAAGKSPFTPDRAHIHHRLLDLGLSHRQAVLVIYAICAGLAALSFFLSGSGQLYAFLGIVVASGVLLFGLARRSLVPEELTAESYPETTIEAGRQANSASAVATGGTTADGATPSIRTTETKPNADAALPSQAGRSVDPTDPAGSARTDVGRIMAVETRAASGPSPSTPEARRGPG